MAKKSNPLKFFNDQSDARVKKMQFGGTQSEESKTTAGVIDDYTKKRAYGQPGGPSFVSNNPAPSFKKGGSKKKY